MPTNARCNGWALVPLWEVVRVQLISKKEKTHEKVKIITILRIVVIDITITKRKLATNILTNPNRRHWSHLTKHLIQLSIRHTMIQISDIKRRRRQLIPTSIHCHNRRHPISSTHRNLRLLNLNLCHDNKP